MSTVEITVEQIGKIKKIKITLSSNKPKVEFDAYTSGVFPLSMYLYGLRMTDGLGCPLAHPDSIAHFF